MNTGTKKVTETLQLLERIRLICPPATVKLPKRLLRRQSRRKVISKNDRMKVCLKVLQIKV